MASGGLLKPLRMSTRRAFFQLVGMVRACKQSLYTLRTALGLAIAKRFSTSFGIPDGPGDFSDDNLLTALDSSSAVNKGIVLEKTSAS